MPGDPTPLSEPRRRMLAARLGAALIAVAAAGWVIASFTGADDPLVDYGAGRAVAGGAIAGAVVVWFLPWGRWPAWTSLVLPVAGLGLWIGGEAASGYSAADGASVMYVSAALVLPVWVGLTQGRVLTLVSAAASLAALAYVSARPDSTVAREALTIVAPLAVIVGAAIAWTVTRLRWERSLGHRQVSHIETMASSLVGLGERRPGLEDAADLLGGLAGDIFGGEYVTTVLRGADGRLVPASTGVNGGPPPPEVSQAVADSITGGDARLLAVDDGTTGSILIIPLLGPNEIAGAVVVGRPDSSDAPSTLHLAELFGTQAGNALEQLQVIESLSADLRRDELTGLGNRRHADTLLSSLRPGDALVLVDLDNLKTVNDTQGHRRGDELLQHLGDHLGAAMRDSDTVARFGGDEFVLVARAAESYALPMASRLLTSWRAQNPSSSFSAGLAVHPAGQEPETTFEQADAALYAAKSDGRDQVRGFHPSMLNPGGTRPDQSG